MPLNQQQKIIFDFFNNKLRESTIDALERLEKAECYILNAPAGTGKTFLINALSSKFQKDIQILAPTHKACSLLGAGVKTIHSFFNSKLEYSEDGNKQFNFSLPNLEISYPEMRLLIIDEASMVSSEMLTHIIRVRRIVLFTCDEAQLPPVGEEQSPIFSLDCKRFNLSLNMRSMESKDSAVVQAFRNKIYEPPARANLRSIITRSNIEQFVGACKDGRAVILCYTNKRKNYWNERIRAQIFPVKDGETRDKFYINEQLVFSGYRADASSVYYSSDIIDIEKIETKIVEHEHIEITFYKITDQNDVNWFIPKTSIDDKLIQKVLKKKSSYIFNQPLSARKMLWGEFYGFKNKYNPDLDYIYASTVHKAQGSEWDTVYVDYSNISCAEKSQGASFRDRLLYTSVSRMRQNLFEIRSAAN
jgi:exodeoxyribonuclease-5